MSSKEKKDWMDQCQIHMTPLAKGMPSDQLYAMTMVLELACRELNEFRNANHGKPFMEINCIGVTASHTLILFYHPGHGDFTESHYEPAISYAVEIRAEALPKILCGDRVEILDSNPISNVNGLPRWDCYALFYQHYCNQHLGSVRNGNELILWRHLDNTAEQVFNEVMRVAARRLYEQTHGCTIIPLERLRSGTWDNTADLSNSLNLFPKYYPDEYLLAREEIEKSMQTVES